MNIVIATTTTKIKAIFLVVVLVVGTFTAISPSFIIVEVQTQKSESEIEGEKCISYNKSEKLISITCKYTEFADVSRQITDHNILKPETTITTNTNTTNTNTSDNSEKVWLLSAGLKVEKNAILDINSDDVTWLKIIPSKKSPNAIIVEGILKVDSVKITSWNPETNDYIKFSEKAKEDASIYTLIPRPYIKIEETATGPTEIINSELAYLGYSCSGCGGVSFNGGEGIICSLDCSNITIEDNEVYNNGNTGKGRGIAFSINMFDSVARNNYVHHQNIGIDISGESQDNKVYNNKVSDSKIGIDTSEASSKNKVYNNTIMNSINGIVVKTGASDNTFHFNKIVNATESGILNIKDPGTVGNTFENNKLINSKVSTSTTSTTIAVDDDDKSEKK